MLKPTFIGIFIFAAPAYLGAAQDPSYQPSPQASASERAMLASIPLVPVSASVRKGCRTAALKLKVAIYCPARVPAHWETEGAMCIACNGTFSITGEFPAPKSYIGVPGDSAGHFTVWASPPKLIRKGYVGCTTGKTFGHVIIARLHMQWVNCPAGSTLDSGHVLLEWSQDTWVYVLSLHSDTRTNRKLLRTMAAHLIRFG